MGMGFKDVLEIRTQVRNIDRYLYSIVEATVDFGRLLHENETLGSF